MVCVFVAAPATVGAHPRRSWTLSQLLCSELDHIICGWLVLQIILRRDILLYLGFRSRDFGRGGLEEDFFEWDTLVRKQLSALIKTRNINILNLSLCDWREKLGLA